jgi:hypothetical protein
VSFDSSPGPGDGSLPPVDVVVPDDARELARDVLAYRREVRARRRRERMLRILGPLGRTDFIRRGTIFPLIASLVALSLLVGTLLSVVTMGPVSAPTATSAPQVPARLPDGGMRLDNGQVVPTSRLAGSLLALIPPTCDCGPVLESLARQAASAGAPVYFVYDAQNTDYGAAGLASLTARYGAGVARSVYDLSGVLFAAYMPYRVTALLVHRDSTVDVRREFPAGFDLTPALRGLHATH